LGQIAEGGQALIARARDRQTGQLVAVKLLTSVAAQNSEFVQRLAREQEAMLALAGTSAVAVLDLCRAPGGAPCLVMELLEGEDLEHYLGRIEKRGQRLELDRVFEIFDAIVETLATAHAAGILHRDLKPANIFVLSEEGGGGVRLLDFGLSRMKTASPLTVLGTILGSPSYIAPEVWAGKTDELDQRVDVYSLSVILYRVLSGRLPFEAEALHDKFIQITTLPRPKLTDSRPDLPRAVDEWVQRALAIDPTKRFPEVRDTWNALLAALDYAPKGQRRAPVHESIVSAWRAAAGVFRRAIAGIPTPLPPQPGRPRSEPPRSAAPPAPSRSPRPPAPSVAPKARTAPPPPPVRRKPVEVTADWLLDGDVLESETGLDPERLVEDAASIDFVGAAAAPPTPHAKAELRPKRRKKHADSAASERATRARLRRKRLRRRGLR
jgi:serine/threonine-protein kinase